MVSFAKFLHLAATESGKAVNLSKLSQEIDVVGTTIATYYPILENCVMKESVEPLTASKLRRHLTKIPNIIFILLGARRVSVREGRESPKAYWGNG